jgi:hypothetical protein
MREAREEVARELRECGKPAREGAKNLQLRVAELVQVARDSYDHGIIIAVKLVHELSF